jgi:hypothetical protein
VGIGTSSPDTLLNIQGLDPTLLIQDSDEAGDGFIKFKTANGTQRGYIQTAMTSNVMIFGTGTSECMRINLSGNVGIGTSSISGKLSINGEVYAAAGSVSGVAYGFYPKGTYGNTGMFSPAANTVAFATTGGERVRIASNGDLLVGTTSAFNNGKQCIAFNSASHVGIALNQTNANNSGTFLNFTQNGTTIGYITGNATTTTYATSSDYRLKEDWVAVADASTRVNALKPVNFAWKADGKRVDGFLAHELAEVVPEAVTGEKDAVDADGNPKYQGIDQSKLVPLLTAALQEALAQIESLTARVSALEGN